MSMLDNVERVKAIFKSIADAALSAGRDPSGIAMIAVSKGHTVEQMKSLVSIEIGTFGESRIQEALPKIEAFAGTSGVVFHFIGRFQINKAKQAVGNFALIHSVDRLPLAEALNKHAEAKGHVQDILLQVNLAKEPQKGGVYEEDLKGLYESVSALKNLRIKGFMMVPPLDEAAEHNRPLFKKMRVIFERYQKADAGIDILSMGMSHDYTVAVQEGANMVRIGTALFGE